MFAQQTREHAIILMDPEGKIVWWSPGAEQVFGHPPERVAGQLASIIFTPEDRERGIDRLELAVAGSDNVAEDDRWQLRADGSRLWASGIVLAIRGEAGELVGYTKLLRNRTDLREQIEALRNQVQELERDCRNKEVFFSTLSHELHNPLSPLTTAVRIIRDGLGGVPEDVEYALRIVERQIALLRRLVDDILDFARMGAGKLELRAQPVALEEVISQAVESARPLIEQRRHRLDVGRPDTPTVVHGDPDRLLQVFVNLLINAAKYTPPGGRIWIHATIEGHEAVVHVRDTGVGIPTDMLPRIFDLFTQVETAKAYAQGGLGIGLSLVKSFVALHGGSVQVRSDGEGKGADFTVRLPLPLE